ncbi:MAG TPA: CoA transferase [Tetrasphaera sp.]|uniref:CaiB/BaiF CoA-transferase family protein n=1 Tax=Nostocoides vanveenii TaxID=330835 RepID=A0ABN2KWF6_9MICO|nr:CoA transferase [Tetrasphaera sp.]HNQ07575.1 CoA transferase [Tetrasphaera sp.]
MRRPLTGLLVADFSRVLAGPLATMYLADLGATVVKVERPGRGDDTRAWGPPWTENSSSYFEALNRGKLSVAWDLNDPADLAKARELARRADVLVENFMTGTLARFGLGYAAVRTSNPGIVYASITGFGSGAGASLPGYDFVAQAFGGLMSITGEQGGAPQKVGVALVDVLTGKDATIGILAALQQRAVSGAGEHIEVNLVSSLLGSLVNQASAFLTTGVAPAAMGNAHPSIAPYEPLQCADLPLAVACGNDGQFVRLTGALGIPALADDPRFATNADRVANRESLVAALEAQLTTEPAAHWEQRLRAAGVAAAPVNDIGTAFAQARDLGLTPTFSVGDDHPEQVRNPILFSGNALDDATPPPGVGEHTLLVEDWLASSDPRPTLDQPTRSLA